MYIDNIRELTGLEPPELCDVAHNRPRWRKITVEASKRAPYDQLCQGMNEWMNNQ